MSTAKKAPAFEIPEITRVSLSQLYLHKINPRKRVSEAEIEALAGSIEDLGLLQNLLGFRDPENDGIGIVAGGRRLRALQLLSEKNGTQIEVPVSITDDSETAQLWAGAENSARMALHPAVEIDGFHKMIERGASVRDVAKAFAVDEPHVKKMLKLAALAKPVLKALADDKITVAQARAFTSAKSKKAQIELLKNGIQWNLSPSEIRQSLNEAAEIEGEGRTRLITRDEYVAAGGSTRSDLFSEEVYYDNADAVQKAIEAKFTSQAEACKSEGWAWVKVEAEHSIMPYQLYQTYGRLYPETPEISEEQEALFHDLGAAIDAETATEEDIAKHDEIAALLETEVYSPEQKAVSGVVIARDYHGGLVLERGLMTDDNQKAAIAAGLFKDNKASKAGAPEASKEDKPKFSAAVLGDLTAIRMLAVQSKLVANPTLALEIIGFALTHDEPYFPVSLSPVHANNRPTETDGLNVADSLYEGERSYNYSPPPKLAKMFDRYRAKPLKDRNAEIAQIVAGLLHGGLKGPKTSQGVFDSIATELNASVRDIWTPTQAFFKRLTTSVLDEIWMQVHGVKTVEDFAGKKAEKVARLHDLFNDPATLKRQPKATQERVKSWVPEDMEFDAPKKKPAQRAKKAS